MSEKALSVPEEVAVMLPPDSAFAASRHRAELAGQLARSCPPELAAEIALVGSTARGLADDDSDLELNLWRETLPPLDTRLDWLRAAGATDIHAEAAPRPDDSYWIACRLGDIPAEVGWQTFAALDANVERLRSGVVVDRKALFLADILVSAIPLRTSGRLAALQAMLNGYSDAVQRAIIDMAVERWSQPEHFAALRRLARHGETLALTERLLADIQLAVRVLYAVNRRWEPSEKWTLTLAREFAPFDLHARIDAILGDSSLEPRVERIARLCLDVLAHVPETIDVSAAVAVLEERGYFGKG
jgi:hypothetical protein